MKFFNSLIFLKKWKKSFHHNYYSIKNLIIKFVASKQKTVTKIENLLKYAGLQLSWSLQQTNENPFDPIHN